MIIRRTRLRIVAADAVIPDPPTIVPAYMYAGQSNEDGRIALTERPQWMIDNGNTLEGAIINNADTLAWANYNIPLHSSGNVFSYDLLLSKMILDYQRSKAGHSTDKIYLIKKAVGGTSLASNWNVANVGDANNLSLALKNRYQASAASPQATIYDLKALFWHQGESDNNSGATSYYTNMKALISYVRNYTGKANLVFVLGGINTSSTDYNATVQNAKIQIDSEDPYVFFAPVSNGTQYLNGDSLHFNYAGGLDLATSVFNIMLANKSLFGLYN